MNLKRLLAVVAVVVTAFSASWLVYEVVVNVVTRDVLCKQFDTFKVKLLEPQIRKQIVQTKRLRIKGFSGAERQKALIQAHRFIHQLDKPTCASP